MVAHKTKQQINHASPKYTRGEQQSPLKYAATRYVEPPRKRVKWKPQDEQCVTDNRIKHTGIAAPSVERCHTATVEDAEEHDGDDKVRRRNG